MLRKSIFLILFMKIAFAKLIPTPFITDPIEIQRLNRNLTQEYFQRSLFSQCYGIALVQMRVSSPSGFLCVVSDPQWHRLVYSFGIETDSERKGKWIYGFGSQGSGNGQFKNPRGLCIDSVTFQGDVNKYYVYVADRDNGRIVRLIYNSQDSLLDFYDNCMTSISHPSDVACAVVSGTNSSYLVISESGLHRIRVYRVMQNLAIQSILNYGSYGSGVGQFNSPCGVEIVPILESPGEYYIYVTDSGNNRIVCLRFNGSAITWEKVYEDVSGVAGFNSVTASEYYCVYVTASGLGQVWVFAPGLNELLYRQGSYGSGNGQFLGPKDICIYKDEIAITEDWTATTGIHYFKIIPEVREFYPDPAIFDATEDSVKINFKVYETKHYLTI